MNGYTFAIVFVPLMAFLVIVMPTWLTLYYRDKKRQGRELSDNEWADIEQTLKRAERMEQRIETLESILDTDHAGWRNKS